MCHSSIILTFYFNYRKKDKFANHEIKKEEGLFALPLRFSYTLFTPWLFPSGAAEPGINAGLSALIGKEPGQPLFVVLVHPAGIIRIIPASVMAFLALHGFDSGHQQFLIDVQHSADVGQNAAGRS